jgi:hypothetical protein
MLGVLIPMTLGVEGRARIAQATAGARQLSSAIVAYVSHIGRPPMNLSTLTSPATNPQGQSAGPFIDRLPTPPCGWTEFRYEYHPDGTFGITTTGEGVTVKEP